MAKRFTMQDVRGTLKPRDAWWTVFLVDPYASRLTLWIANGTTFSPNFITLVSFMFGMLAAIGFGSGTRGGLFVGAGMYHLSFVMDCVDGKIARLKGTGSVFGMWLDYTFDRVRVIGCAIALMASRYGRTHDVVYVWLAFAVVTLDMLRYLNVLQVEKMKSLMFSKLGIVGSQQPTDQPRIGAFGDTRAWYRPIRDRLERHRVRAHFFSGVEFQMFVFIIGPLTGFVKPVTIGSCALMAAFELLAVYRVRALTKDYAKRTSRKH